MRRPLILRRSLLLLSLVAGLGAGLPAFAASYAVSMVEGKAGPCRIGQPAPSGQTDAEGFVHSPDDEVLCREGADGRVVEIRIFSPLYYTAKYLLSVGSSTFDQVFAALGEPVEIGRNPDGGLVLTYERVRFHFRPAADRRSQHTAPVTRIDLLPPDSR